MAHEKTNINKTVEKRLVGGEKGLTEHEKNLVNRVYANLSDNLRFLRMLHGFSQDKICEKVHISRKHYCECERGNAVPSLIIICILADIYEVPLDRLVSSKLSYECKEMIRGK